MLADLRYAIRSLVRRPLMTAVAVGSLALGIGVNTTIFSVFDRLLLQRLSVPDANRIVLVTSPGPRTGSRSTGDAGGVEAIFSYPLFRDLEQLDGSLPMAAHRNFSANLAYGGQTIEGEGLLVSGRYFSLLGLTPSLGRLLGPDDNRVPGNHPVVVLSHDYWSTRFGSNPRVVNDTMLVNGELMTIVGVAPAGFVGNTTLDRPHVFIPLTMARQAYRGVGWNGATARDNHWLYAFGRLPDGVTSAQAEQMLNLPFANLIRDVELPALQESLNERTQEEFSRRRIVLTDGSRARNSDRDEIETLLVLLFAVTGFVLAIACANVANLLLARVVDRSSEIAVRLSMGASGPRIVRLLLIETCVIGILGGAGALLVVRLALAGLLALMPVEDRLMLAFTIDSTVLTFALATGLVTSLLFGMFPALYSVRHAVAAGLQAQSSRGSESRSAKRFRTSMATMQVALATALLAVAGLFIVSLVNVSRADLGLRREGLATFRLSPALNGYTPERTRALYREVEERLAAMPGVTAVSASTVPILSSSNWNNVVSVEGFEAGPDADRVSSFARVGVGYFRTLGIPLLSGREFTDRDDKGAPLVAVVNEAFVRKFTLGARVIGTRIGIGSGPAAVRDIEIVGLVRDAKYSQVSEPAPPQFFLPDRQADTGTLTFYVRASADTRIVLSAITPLMQQVSPDLPVTNLRSLDEQIWDNTTANRVLFTLSSWFAGLATLLAAVGLYAVLAYGVAQRVREIGIRIALGAQRTHIGWLVFSHVWRITVVGSVIGAALAIGLGRLAETLLVDVEGSNGGIVSAAVAVVVLSAIGAALGPARRATRIDPVATLR